MPDRSRVFKTPAIVLRRSDFGEADVLLTLFTPYYGKIRAIAKAARRPLAKTTGHVELYTLSDMVLSQGRDLHIVTQADLKEPFLMISSDLERIGYASLFAELIDRFSVDNQENQPAFRLLIDGLRWLCESEVDLRLAARYYEFRLLQIMGFAPSLFECAISGKPLEARDQFFSPADGGVVAAEYGMAYSHMIPLPLDVFKILRHFSRHDWEQVKLIKLRPHHHCLLERILHSNLAYLLEQRLQSIAFLRRLASLHSGEE
jgi:DNA repair protein RecO (recombination protein O)